MLSSLMCYEASTTHNLEKHFLPEFPVKMCFGDIGIWKISRPKYSWWSPDSWFSDNVDIFCKKSHRKILQEKKVTTSNFSIIFQNVRMGIDMWMFFTKIREDMRIDMCMFFSTTRFPARAGGRPLRGTDWPFPLLGPGRRAAHWRPLVRVGPRCWKGDNAHGPFARKIILRKGTTGHDVILIGSHVSHDIILDIFMRIMTSSPHKAIGNPHFLVPHKLYSSDKDAQ